MDKGYIKIDGGTIFYRVFGKGEPIIFLHGGPGTPHDYLIDSFIELKDKYQLIFYDQRGVGLSDYDYKKPLNLEDYLKDINTIQEKLKLSKFHLIGHSFGGFLAALYASKNSDKLFSMTIISTAPGNASLDKEISNNKNNRLDANDLKSINEILMTDPIKKEDIKAINKIVNIQAKAIFYNPSFIQKPLFHNFKHFMKSQMVNRAFDQELEKYDLYPVLKNINCKTIILHGAHDAIPLSVPNNYHQRINNSNLIIFEKSGHFPFVEEHKKFIDILLNFLVS